MPILEVIAIGPLDAELRKGGAQRIADACAEVLAARPGGCWARLREVDAGDYAESGGAGEGVKPVFVHVLQKRVLAATDRARCAEQIAARVSEILKRPSENVHVLFEPSPAGQIAFGGELVPAAKERIASAAKWEAIVGYSRAVRAGNLIFVTGTTAFGAKGEPVGVGDAYTQAKQCLDNIQAALAQLGAGPHDVVRTRMFVTDIERDWEPVGRAHAEVFGAIRPATTLVEVRKLIADWMLVEIEADAVLG